MRPCEVCGSRRWRKAPNGLVSCEEGHILQNYRQEESNMDEPSQFALTKRTIRRERAGGSGKRKRERRLEGDAQRMRRLEVLQLLLRCQVKAVQHLWAIGDELERVVRDLWIVVLEDVERAQAAAASTGDHLSATQPDAQKSQGAPPLSSTSDSDSQSKSDSTNTTSSTSTSDTDTDSSAFPQDLLDKLSSSPPSSPSGQNNILPPTQVRRRGRKPLPNAWRHGTTRSRITATTVLRILVLGLWMIRVPVMVVDVIREVERGGIPYLSWRVEGMRGGWRGGMARRPPSVPHFYHSIVTLADRLERYAGIRIPDGNVPLLLWRLTKEMGGTPFLYTQTFKLLQRLDVSMTISRPKEYSRHYYNSRRRASQADSGLAPEPSSSSDNEGDENKPARSRRLPIRRLGELCPVELRLAASLIISLKLAYGLDNDPARTPLDIGDPACCLPKADEWLRELRSKWEEGWFRRHVVSPEPIDFAYQTEQEAEKFLMQAERVLLGVPNRVPDRQQIVDLFPVDENVGATSLGDTDEVYETWRGYHSRAEPNLPLNKPEQGDSKRRGSRSGSVDSTTRRTRRVAFEPGRAYKVYDWRKADSSTSPSSGLPRDLALVVDVVAEITGLGRIDVLKELYALEMLLQFANRQIRRREGKGRKSETGRASAATSVASTTDEAV